MKRMLLILLLAGIACGQFTRFDNSFEDDSDENFFRSRQSPTLRNSRFDDSDERFFRSGGRRNSFVDSRSDEHFFGGRRNSNRNRFDDSDEVFFGSNPNSFVSNRNPNRFSSFNRNTNLRTPTPSFRARTSAPAFNSSPFNRNANTNTFNRNNNLNRNSNFNRNNNFNRRNTFNHLKIDSVEDLFEDLFDDDLDDRLKAQNTLSRLGINHNNLFRNSGQNQNRGFSNFNSQLGSNRFRSQTTTIRPNFRSQFKNPLDHFSIKQHTNRSPSAPTVNRFNNGFSFGTTVGSNNRFQPNRNQFSSNANRGVPLRSNFQSAPRTSSPNTFRSSKTNSPSPFNSIRSNSFGQSKRSSPFPSSTGFNWPGGNGYYVSMSQGNSKPVSYFVKYDD